MANVVANQFAGANNNGDNVSVDLSDLEPSIVERRITVKILRSFKCSSIFNGSHELILVDIKVIAIRI